MALMRKNIYLLLFCFMLPMIGKAQLGFVGYAEYGYSMFKYKSDELSVFLSSYNSYYNLAKPFELKLGAAKGTYLKFGIGIGGNVKGVMDFTIYKAKTNPLEARFADGTGRDIWVEHRCSNTDIGVRFGGTKEVPLWVQIDMDIAIQVTSIYSAYVYADGSRSLGIEKNLNGVYSDFVGVGGLGLTAGCRIYGPLGISISANYMFNLMRGTPEYHQYSDLNDVKPLMQPDYLPRDMGTYINDPYNGTGNSISNDFRGWKFTGGLVLSIGDWGK